MANPQHFLLHENLKIRDSSEAVTPTFEFLFGVYIVIAALEPWTVINFYIENAMGIPKINSLDS